MAKIKDFLFLALAVIGGPLLLSACVLYQASTLPEEQPTPPRESPPSLAEVDTAQREALVEQCAKDLRNLAGDFRAESVDQVCDQVAQLNSCESLEGRPIYHFEKEGVATPNQRILVLSLIHGDETASGSVARSWLARLREISPRNTWRVLPIVNPDGYLRNSRLNSRGVDLNRNFPTQDWDELALKSWREKAESNPRRYPGPQGASEPETTCTIEHIKDFKPDFIISIHTPLGVLDFDGPTNVTVPNFKPLPWRSLGHFPGSLGRYMWKEHGVPVLTVELKGDEVARRSLEAFDRLQDITGTVAIQAQQIINQMGIEQKIPSFQSETNQDLSMDTYEAEEIPN